MTEQEILKEYNIRTSRDSSEYSLSFDEVKIIVKEWMDVINTVDYEKIRFEIAYDSFRFHILLKNGWLLYVTRMYFMELKFPDEVNKYTAAFTLWGPKPKQELMIADVRELPDLIEGVKLMYKEENETINN